MFCENASEIKVETPGNERLIGDTNTHFQGYISMLVIILLLLLFYNRMDVYFLQTCLDICLFVVFFSVCVCGTGDYVTHNIN